jgi:hypothetical protein
VRLEVERKTDFLPLILSLFLVVWTAAVYPFSDYDDGWAIYPALLVLPLTFLTHAWLIVTSHRKLRALFYGLIHVVMQSVVWVGCLFLISKDWL